MKKEIDNEINAFKLYKASNNAKNKVAYVSNNKNAEQSNAKFCVFIIIIALLNFFNKIP